MKTQFRAALILFNYCPYIIVYAIYVICNYYIVPSCTNTVESRIAIVISHQGILISSSILPVKSLIIPILSPIFQMQSLISQIDSLFHHFVRCLRGNQDPFAW